MRRVVSRAAVTAALVAVLVLAVPLALAIHLLVVDRGQGELERLALSAAARISPDYLSGDLIELPDVPDGFEVGVYDPSGGLRAGTGPESADEDVLTALRGTSTRRIGAGWLTVAVPVTGDERVTGAVRAASPTSQVWRRDAVGWAALAAAACATRAATSRAAHAFTRRIVAPLERLAVASAAVGEGRLEVRLKPSGIPEIDRVADTQAATVERLADLLGRERQFIADVSHQLRTPLTGLQLTLEAAASDAGHEAFVDEALDVTHRLQATVEDVLALHRRTPDAGVSAVASVIAEVIDAGAARWRPPLAIGGRKLSVDTLADTGVQVVMGARVGQILDILLDNALRHGAGQVRMRLRPMGLAVAIDVSDEGSGITGTQDVFRRGVGRDHGIGLGLARDLAASLGGRLVLGTRTPPTFTLILPAVRGQAPSLSSVIDGGIGPASWSISNPEAPHDR